MLKREVVESTISKTFADKLDELIFQVGEMEYSRREMVEVLGCANFIAAANLARVLKRLKITTVHQLAKTDPVSLARVRGIGASSIFVAMCILDAKSYDPVKWWGYNNNVVKFSSFKAAAMRKASKRKQDVA